MKPTRSRNLSGRRCLLVILGGAALIRVVAALYLGNAVAAPPLMTDQLSYHFLAVRLLQGYGYSFDKAWYPFTSADMPTAHWSFLYPLFLAGVYAVFGAHPLAARLIQGILGGILLPWMVYRLATVAFETGEQGGKAMGYRHALSMSPPYAGVPLVAAAIAALYGYFVLYAVILMTETFYIVTLLWSLTAGLKMSHLLQDGKRPSSWLALQLGLSLGVAALLRQSILPWVPVLFATLAWQAWRGRRLRSAVGALAIAGSLLVASILPWTYRNFRVYGQFLLLNSNTGYAMYSAQHPMHGTRFREFDAARLPEDLLWGSEAAMDRALMRAGMQFVLKEPGRYVLLCLSRVRALFEFWPTRDTTLLHNAGRVASFGLFLPFVLYGLYLVARDPGIVARDPGTVARDPSLVVLDRSWAARNGLLFLFVAFYTTLHVLTWAMVRYRLPVDAALMPVAALAVLDLSGRLRSVRWRRGRRVEPERCPD